MQSIWAFTVEEIAPRIGDDFEACGMEITRDRLWIGGATDAETSSIPSGYAEGNTGRGQWTDRAMFVDISDTIAEF